MKTEENKKQQFTCATSMVVGSADRIINIKKSPAEK